MFQIERFWRQVSKKVCFWNSKFQIKSDSGIIFFQRVRFWIERFLTCRILNYIFSNSHGSGLSFLQRVRVWINLLSRKKINFSIGCALNGIELCFNFSQKRTTIFAVCLHFQNIPSGRKVFFFKQFLNWKLHSLWDSKLQILNPSVFVSRFLLRAALRTEPFLKQSGFEKFYGLYNQVLIPFLPWKRQNLLVFCIFKMSDSDGFLLLQSDFELKTLQHIRLCIIGFWNSQFQNCKLFSVSQFETYFLLGVGFWIKFFTMFQSLNLNNFWKNQELEQVMNWKNHVFIHFTR